MKGELKGGTSYLPNTYLACGYSLYGVMSCVVQCDYSLGSFLGTN
ncbi:hypothetical protein [Ascidiimonas sp. W6]